MYDPDAPRGTFIHWMAHQKASTTSVFPSPVAVEGRNDFGETGYGGPCPPRGHGAHRYFILIVALDEELELPYGYSIDDLLNAMNGHIVSWGYSMGTYSR